MALMVIGSAGALAQGLGIGVGLDDLRMIKGTGGGGGGCATNFVFDWSVATGCNAITAVIR